MRETIRAWQAQATKTLDVRPILENGGEPFVLILEAATPLRAGDSLLLTAPFEPVPLYAALAERGFTTSTIVAGLSFADGGGCLKLWRLDPAEQFVPRPEREEWPSHKCVPQDEVYGPRHFPRCFSR